MKSDLKKFIIFKKFTIASFIISFLFWISIIYIIVISFVFPDMPNNKNASESLNFFTAYVKVFTILLVIANLVINSICIAYLKSIKYKEKKEKLMRWATLSIFFFGIVTDILSIHTSKNIIRELKMYDQIVNEPISTI